MPKGKPVDPRGRPYRTWSKSQLAAALARFGVQVALDAITRMELLRLVEQHGIPEDMPRTPTPGLLTKQLLADELAQLGKQVNPEAMTRRELITLLHTARNPA